MSFASDAQRRWFFANLGTGGGGSGGSDGFGSGSGGGSSSGSGGGGEFTSSAVPLSEMREASPRQLDRIAYAQAMYPHLSEPDALRQLNDREGFGGLK